MNVSISVNVRIEAQKGDDDMTTMKNRCRTMLSEQLEQKPVELIQYMRGPEYLKTVLWTSRYSLVL